MEITLKLFFPDLGFLVYTDHKCSRTLQLKMSLQSTAIPSQFARRRWICTTLICGFTVVQLLSLGLGSVWTPAVVTINTNLLGFLGCIIAPPLWTRGSPSPAPGRGRKCCQSPRSSPPQRDEYWERTWDETRGNLSRLLLR